MIPSNKINILNLPVGAFPSKKDNGDFQVETAFPTPAFDKDFSASMEITVYLGINLITIAFFPTKTKKQKPKHNNNQKFTTGLNELQQLEGPPAKNTSDIHHRHDDALDLNYTLLNTTEYTDRQTSLPAE